MSEQINAIRDLGHSGYFPHLNTANVADQLTERVVLPFRVNQGNTGLCGAAAFTSTLAELRPAEYVQLAYDLLFRGEGSVRALQVKPGDFVRNFNPRDASVPDADWLLLASIRNDPSAELMKQNPGHYGGAGTYEVYGWLKNAEYPHVHYIAAAEKFEYPPGKQPGYLGAMYNNVDANMAHKWHPSKPPFLDQKTGAELASTSENMNLSKKLLANDWSVIGQVSEKYANSGSASGATQAIAELEELGAPPAQIAAMKKKLEAEMVGSGTNHWAVVKEAQIRQGEDGTMRAGMTRYSWGTEEPTATVPMDQFKKMYGGMIAISDDPQADQKWKR